MAVEARSKPSVALGIDLEAVYRSLYLIRHVEEEIARVYPTDKIKSPVHLSIGQESIPVAVCQSLRVNDVVFGTYRGHALYLAKGGNLRQMIAELYGKTTGAAKGKGGSMHLIDSAHGVMGMSAVVGTTIPHAAGYAYALKVRRSDCIVASFFGDGATEEGVFYETLNFAALKNLPILFVCENNGYAIHSPISKRQANMDIASRARALGVPALAFQTDDVVAMATEFRHGIDAIRGGAGPRFFECPIYRWKEHVGPGDDFHVGYRSLAEAQPWIDGDQVRRIGQLLSPLMREAIDQEVEQEVREAFDFAETSSFPENCELGTDVFAS